MGPNGLVQSLQDPTTVGVDVQGEWMSLDGVLDGFGTYGIKNTLQQPNLPWKPKEMPLKYEVGKPSRLFLLRFGNLNHPKLGDYYLITL